MSNEALKKAIQGAGGATVLGAAIGITSQAISQWRQVPAERVLAVEAVSGVSRQDLRPDLYPPEIAAE